MKRFRLSILYIIGAILLVELQNSAHTIHESNIYERKEKISNNNFYFKEINIDGQIYCHFYVDSIPVEKERYDESLLEAKKEEWIKEREMQEQKRHADLYFKNSAKLEILKKLLNNLYLDIASKLKKINNFEGLSQYYVFSNDTFNSLEELEQIEDELLPQSKKLIKNSEKNELITLNEFLEKIENLPEKLDKFFKDSVENAIKKCDDTKFLKRLLEFIE